MSSDYRLNQEPNSEVILKILCQRCVTGSARGTQFMSTMHNFLRNASLTSQRRAKKKIKVAFKSTAVNNLWKRLG